MRGRKGQPAEIKAAKGNPGKRANPVVATEDLPELSGGPPRFLTNAGKAVWRVLAPQLSRIQLLRVTDHQALARYCDCLATYWEITRDLRRGKYVSMVEKIGGGKMPRINPLFMVQDRLGRRLDVLEDRFGLTPRARQEIMFRLAQKLPELPFPGTDRPDDQPAPGAVGCLTQSRSDGDPTVH